MSMLRDLAARDARRATSSSSTTRAAAPTSIFGDELDGARRARTRASRCSCLDDAPSRRLRRRDACAQLVPDFAERDDLRCAARRAS